MNEVLDKLKEGVRTFQAETYMANSKLYEKAAREPHDSSTTALIAKYREWR